MVPVSRMEQAPAQCDRASMTLMPSNITFHRTAGSHSLAAAGQRERSAYGQ